MNWGGSDYYVALYDVILINCRRLGVHGWRRIIGWDECNGSGHNDWLSYDKSFLLCSSRKRRGCRLVQEQTTPTCPFTITISAFCPFHRITQQVRVSIATANHSQWRVNLFCSYRTTNVTFICTSGQIISTELDTGLFTHNYFNDHQIHDGVRCWSG